MRRTVTLVLLVGIAVASVQQPLSAPSLLREAGVDEPHYQFDWPIDKVAIIGAGASGLLAYRELTEVGFNVRIFEREGVPGGNWHYTDEIPLDTPVPNPPVAIGDFVPSLPPPAVDLPYSETFEDDGKIWRDHRGPKPIWESLTSNSPSAEQQFTQWPWPAGTQWQLTQYQIRNYVRSYASYLHINSNDGNPATAYNTRVERVEKRINEAGQEQGWRLWLRSLGPTQNNSYRATWWTEDFDAVVVAVGRYNAPFMPNIPGLGEWVRRFPDFIRHSRQYRRPDPYANQTVLIIGASASGGEISRDLNRHARKVYQSYRPDKYNTSHYALDSFLHRIPKNTTIVGEIKRFLPIPDGAPIQSGLVELKNGTILSRIDRVILATGFRYSFPFLSQYYDGAAYVPHSGSAPTVSHFLPLDGTHIRDLYLDQFYIRDPTLAFIGAPLATASFIFPEYMTFALAKVWANTAKLPNCRTMEALHEQIVQERGGYGKYFMFLGPKRAGARIAYLVGWLNMEAVKYGGKQINGLPNHLKEVEHYWEIAHFGGPVWVKGPERDKTMLMPPGGLSRDAADKGGDADMLFYDGDW